MKKEDGSNDFVCGHLEIYEEQIPPVAFVKNGNDLLAWPQTATHTKNILEIVAKQIGQS